MKKYLIALAVSVGASVGLNVNLVYNSMLPKKSDISMDNVEALASTEDPNVACLYPGSIDCPVSTIKVKYVL